MPVTEAVLSPGSSAKLTLMPATDAVLSLGSKPDVDAFD